MNRSGCSRVIEQAAEHRAVVIAVVPLVGQEVSSYIGKVTGVTAWQSPRSAALPRESALNRAFALVLTIRKQRIAGAILGKADFRECVRTLPVGHKLARTDASDTLHIAGRRFPLSVVGSPPSDLRISAGFRLSKPLLRQAWYA
jgi:hypothetical protein